MLHSTVPHRSLPRLGVLLLLTLTLASVGCGPRTVSQKLVGRWEGQPDTFAAQREREPIPTAAGHEPKPAGAQPVVQSEMAKKVARLQPSEKTDLEAYDFAITLEFKSNGHVDMWLNEQDKKTGAWQVLSTDVGVSRLELSDGLPSKSKDDTSSGQLTKRRFSLKLNKDADGFTLREEGIDPRFGWLYFTKAEDERGKGE